MILNGCNVMSGNIEAYVNGSINFNIFTSTGRVCEDDKDFVYVNALTNAAMYS